MTGISSAAQAPRRGRRGIGTVDLIIWVSAVASISVTLFVGLPFLQNMIRDNTHRTTLRTVWQAVDAGYSGRATFGSGGIGLSRFIADGSIDAAIHDGTNVLNPYGGTITVTGNGAGGFTLESPQVPTADCIRQITGQWPTSKVTKVGVGANVFTPPVGDDDASSACAAATNTLKLVIRR